MCLVRFSFLVVGSGETLKHTWDMGYGEEHAEVYRDIVLFLLA